MKRPFTLTVLNIPDTGRGVGLALVLQTPNGRTWLYDSGNGYPEGGGWLLDSNSGRDQIAPFLSERGIERLDGIIISHAHYDHFGGLSWLVDHMPTGTLIDTGYTFEGDRDDHYDTELADYQRLRETYRSRGYYRSALAGDMLDLDPDLEVEVIAPPPGFFQPDPDITRADWNPAAHYMLNSNSLMLRIRYGETVFLLPGDIEMEDQKRYLLRSVPPEKLRCNVLVAPGHGLHTHPDFVQATLPQVTVVSLFERWLSSCSACEGFGAVGSEVYVSGRDGDVQVRSDGETFTVHAG
jgi:competence protein ComEC